MNQSTQVIINASAHEIPLPDGMIHTVVTSPPYYSLRKYQGAQEVDWPEVVYKWMPGMLSLFVEPMRCALGLEPTPEAYIGHLVLCFREVARVLRDDGVCWVVMGDSYGANYRWGGEESASAKQRSNTGTVGFMGKQGNSGGDLMLIPARLALALQADGWLVRNDVVWHKVAPMPESVSGWRWERCRVHVKKRTAGSRVGATPSDLPGHHPGQVPHRDGSFDTPSDSKWQPCPGCDKCREHGGYVLRRGSWRHTRAHETVLMLARSMGYYADQERVREEAQPREYLNWEQRKALGKFDDGDKRQAETMDGGQYHYRHGQGFAPSGAGRNPRSVLTPRPESFSGSHYAVYPRTLISPLLQATAPTRVCPVCGAPWCPVVEQERYHAQWGGPAEKDHQTGMGQAQSPIRNGQPGCTSVKSSTVGHLPTCDCRHDRRQIPGWVLDPFVGSGTTLEVCAELGVNAIGIDISPEYLDRHAKPRINLTPSDALDELPLFAGIDT